LDFSDLQNYVQDDASLQIQEGPYSIVTCQPVARQRVAKRVPATTNSW
jgi:hypothetical protein